MKQTEGTETSKYLEEKKSKEIPPVVASERGTAQTRSGNIFGVVGLHHGLIFDRRSPWKAAP